MRKIIFLSLGLIGLGLGAVAAALPLLPAFPFLLLAAFSFARGSDRLNSWYRGTKLYRENIGPFVKGRGMTWPTKLKTMGIVTLSMSIGYIMMRRIPVGRLILAVIWVLHILYFTFLVRTMEAGGTRVAVSGDQA